jgi:aquaporin NIP
MNRWMAELVGTFALVFCGTGAIVINQISNGAITHVGIAATFGLVVMGLIYSLGDISGAHLNPAVTLALSVAGRFPWRGVLPYLTAQLLGALLASAVLKGLFPGSVLLGATMPSGSEAQSFVLEVILTFLLMLVILNSTSGPKETGVMAGVAIGAVVGLEAMFAGPICGASMNPARSIGPAVVSQHLEHLWIYLAAPVLGAALAVPVTFLMRPATRETAR